MSYPIKRGRKLKHPLVAYASTELKNTNITIASSQQRKKAFAYLAEKNDSTVSELGQKIFSFLETLDAQLPKGVTLLSYLEKHVQHQEELKEELREAAQQIDLLEIKLDRLQKEKQQVSKQLEERIGEQAKREEKEMIQLPEELKTILLYYLQAQQAKGKTKTMEAWLAELLYSRITFPTGGVIPPLLKKNGIYRLKLKKFTEQAR